MKTELLEEINCSTYSENNEELEKLFDAGLQTDGGESWYAVQTVIENLHDNGYMLVKINKD